jgi:crotonobetainyl-CoA:carnitine CoA-transferase CaiB-like acyl-CoA transferase
VPAAATDYTTGYLGALGALVALARRAREGGSYHVRVSLARTGMWLWDLGRTRGEAPGLDPAHLGSYLVETDTPQGRLRHLAPVLQLSETPPRWDRPAVPLGTHAAAWPEPAP